MRFGLYAVVYGVLVAAQNTVNSFLSGVLGTWLSTLIVHLAGLPIALAAWLIGRAGRPKGARWYEYGGGVVGVLSVVFVSSSVPVLGVTANMALMMLGQLVCSVLIVCAVVSILI